MRISDWSSDVCSSDLGIGRDGQVGALMSDAKVYDLRGIGVAARFSASDARRQHILFESRVLDNIPFHLIGPGRKLDQPTGSITARTGNRGNRQQLVLWIDRRSKIAR